MLSAGNGKRCGMIELRKAKIGEEAEVSALWAKVFGDDGGFLEEFYRRCAPFDRVMVLREEGALRTILTAPLTEVRCPNGRVLKAGYMYALASEPAIRNRGFGRDMMRYGEVCLKGQGADCALLVPAEPSLFRFFDSLDYIPAFSHIRRELAAADCPRVQPGDSLRPAGAEEYNELRRGWLRGRLCMDCSDDMVEFQRWLARESGGDLYRLELPGGAGCAVVELYGDGPVIKELLCAAEDVDRAMALLCVRHPAERFVFRLPVWSGQDGERVLWGAVRWLYGHPSPWWPEGTDGYLGIALD